MLNIGRLNRRITLQRRTEMKDGPRAVASWTDIATVWAELVNWSASEFATGYGEAENGTVIFRIRYLGNITMADRVVYEGKTHDLKEIAEIGNRDGLELRAMAVS